MWIPQSKLGEAKKAGQESRKRYMEGQHMYERIMSLLSLLSVLGPFESWLKACRCTSRLQSSRAIVWALAPLGQLFGRPLSK